MEQLVTYWAWKKIDLERTINSLIKFRAQTPYEHIKADLTFKIEDKITYQRLIESLQTKHKHGELD